MSNWKNCILGDIADITKLAGFEFTKHISYTDSGEIIALRALNIKNGKLDLEEIKRISNHTSESLPRSKLIKDDILFSYTGSVGEVALIDADEKYHMAPNVCRLRVNENAVPEFVYYYLRSITFRKILNGYIVGSTQPTIPMKSIRALGVRLPPPKNQKAIASVISLLDKKIDNNNSINKTLDKLGRAIFKSWFVDFDPVHAEALGTQESYIDSETATLFPKSFGDDGLPDGWNKEALYNIASFVNGASYNIKHFCEKSEGLPIVKITELKYGISKLTKYTNIDLGNKYKIKGSDIFFAWSGNPKTSIDTYLWAYGDGWINQHIFAVRENGFVSEAYLYFQLKLLNPTFIDIAMNKQTAGFGHVTVKDMKELLVVAPTKEVKNAFETNVGPIFDAIKNNLFENQTLAELRDTLLPKLMSGEIRVSDAEREVEAAV